MSFIERVQTTNDSDSLPWLGTLRSLFSCFSKKVPIGYWQKQTPPLWSGWMPRFVFCVRGCHSMLNQQAPLLGFKQRLRKKQTNCKDYSHHIWWHVHTLSMKETRNRYWSQSGAGTCSCWGWEAPRRPSRTSGNSSIRSKTRPGCLSNTRPIIRLRSSTDMTSR